MVNDKNVLNQDQGLENYLFINEWKDFNKSKLSLQEWAEKKFSRGMGELIGRKNARNFMSNVIIGPCVTEVIVKKPKDLDITPAIIKNSIIHQSESSAIKKVNSHSLATPPMGIKKPGTYRPRGVKTKKRKAIEEENFDFSPVGYPEIIITIVPMRRPLQEEEAERHRNFSCQFTTECINYVEDKGVCYFSCSKCSQMKNSNPV